jgi:hypothetical protein
MMELETKLKLAEKGRAGAQLALVSMACFVVISTNAKEIQEAKGRTQAILTKWTEAAVAAEARERKKETAKSKKIAREAKAATKAATAKAKRKAKEAETMEKTKAVAEEASAMKQAGKEATKLVEVAAAKAAAVTRDATMDDAAAKATGVKKEAPTKADNAKAAATKETKEAKKADVDKAPAIEEAALAAPETKNETQKVGDVSESANVSVRNIIHAAHT